MFDIHQSPKGEYDEWDDGLVDDYCNGLMEAFAASPEGATVAAQYGGVGRAHSFLYYGFNYVGSAPPEMSRRDVEEILFELFPRKVSADPDTAGEIIGEMRAFWEFLRRQYGLANATGILQVLGDDAERRLARELARPQNFGMAKSFFMMGKQAGFDMTTQEGLDQFMLAYNASTARNRMGARPPADSANPPWSFSPSPPNPVAARLSATDRKSREKIRRTKLGKSKRRR